MAGIFISYRRADCAGWARLLYDTLARRFDEKLLFMDVQTVRSGEDYVDAIERTLDSTSVVLVLIGHSWLSMQEDGQPRLFAPEDPVRREIVGALSRQDLYVVPILVDGATVPPSAGVPEEIRPLTRRNAVELRHTSWQSDVDRLITFLDSIVSRPSPGLVDDAEAALRALEEETRSGISTGRPRARLIELVVASAIRRINDNDPPDFVGAIALLERLRATVGDDPIARDNLVRMLHQLAVHTYNAEVYDQAAAAIRRALALRPDDPEIRRGAGIVLCTYAATLINQGNPTHAEAVAREAEAFLFEEGVAAGLAAYYQKAERPEDVVRTWRAVYAREPADQQVRSRLRIALHNLGVAMTRTKRWDAAVRSLNEALAIENAAETREQLVQTYLGQAVELVQAGEWADASAVAKRALAIDDTPEIRRHIAVAFHNQGIELANAGRREEALTALRHALTIEELSETRQQLHLLLHNHGAELARLARWDQAVETLKEALRMVNDDRTRLMLADVLVRRAADRIEGGDTTGARADLHEAERLDPEDPRIDRLWEQSR